MTIVLRNFSPRPAARLHLICVPHAGAGASVYNKWPAALPASIEMLAVQLPGREDRFREAPFSEWGPLVEAAGVALEPFATLPVALFGHSFGAVVAWELARWLAERKTVDLAHVFVSGRRRPAVKNLDSPGSAVSLAAAPDDDLLQALDRKYGTLGVASLRDPDVRELVLPALRADVALLEKHQRRPALPLECALTAYAGRGDPSTMGADLDEWRAETRGAFRSRLFEGGHHFLVEQRAALVADVTRSLAERIA